MNGIYLLLGSNLGNRMVWLEQALLAIEKKVGRLKAQSSLYETAAWGKEDQPAFLNQVVEISTKLSPQELITALLQIEQSLDRVREEAWAARTIDLDILYYGDQQFSTPALTIPHPRLHLRRFTLVPLCEIAPLLVHPLLKKNNLQLLGECPDQLEVTLFG
ncbi:2-amino-4-hydroxy-6-hydroxymethyldihydropteridine pyrophosphokinase [Flammeovirgaceae bacterium 311]|nr:2-amino-4-hydroxy-6-hydroxymethyldihydropteridine pyrophosphokinase [Flammeovirgaceae bacterium 311]